MRIPFLKQSVKQASIIIAVFTVISQVLGLFREALIANYFGTSAELDIILLAVSIPLMVSGVLFMAIPSAGIPFLQNSNILSSGNRTILKSKFFNYSHLISLFIAIVLFISFPWVKEILLSKFEPNRANDIIKFGRIFCLLIPLKTYEAIFRCLLHVKHHFIFPSLANLTLNVVLILVLISLYPSLASKALIVAWIFGTFGQMLVVGIPAFIIYRGNGYLSTLSDFNSSGYFRFLGAIIFIEVFGLIIAPFDKYLAAIYLQPGMVSALNYSEIIQSVPFRVLVISLGTAIFPSLAEKAITKDSIALASLYHKAIAYCIFLIIPISFYSYLFRYEIVSILLERGQFDAKSTELTVKILELYFVGLIFTSVFFVQARLFYALKCWRSLGIAKMLGLVLKITIGLMLVKINWLVAIIGGTISMYVFCFIVLEIYLIKKIKIIYSRESIKLIYKAAIGSLLTAVIVILVHNLTGRFGDFTSMIFTAFIGGLVLGAFELKFNILNLNLASRLKIS